MAASTSSVPVFFFARRRHSFERTARKIWHVIEASLPIHFGTQLFFLDLSRSPSELEPPSTAADGWAELIFPVGGVEIDFANRRCIVFCGLIGPGKEQRLSISEICF